MRSRMRYALPALLGVVALAVLAVAYDRTRVVAWIGDYPVQVRVERSSQRPVRQMSAATLFRLEWERAAGDASRIEADWQAVAGAGGVPFTVQVKHGGDNSGLGRQLNYAREGLLVLKVDYTDGGSELVVAELPDSRSSGDLSVKVP